MNEPTAPTAVIATAGHVDHGKSALVRALTGIEPDRWSEERTRGLTIDLGYAWTTLDTGEIVSFVDVPGHQRFIGNMLAGLGPTAAVLFIVAADEGWRQQSTEHLHAIDAIGISHGLLVITRCDLADATTTQQTLSDARERLASTSLGNVDAVVASARTGAGLNELRAALARLIDTLPTPRRDGRTRMWIDRSFSIRGAGTVATGTLGEGSLSRDDRVRLIAPRRADDRSIRIRGLHSLDAPRDSVTAIARTAVNLADVPVDNVGRGDVLLAGEWALTSTVDVTLTGAPATDLPEYVMVHVGTYAGQVRVRPLGDDHARLHLPAALPLVVNDRLILRDPGVQHIVGGAQIADAAPPPLHRRGAAAARSAQLTQSPNRSLDEVSRRGAVRESDLLQLGLDAGQIPGVRRIDDWLIADAQWRAWVEQLTALLTRQEASDPLEPSIAEDAAVRALALPQRRWLADIAADADAQTEGGRVQRIGVRPDLGAAEPHLARFEQQLADAPWNAPEQHDLVAAGLGARELAAAVRLGRIIRLPGDVVLLPTGPARAMRVLATLTQPFTTSEARQALGTTRRVAVPLLEHLDARGWTRRLNNNLREIIR